MGGRSVLVRFEGQIIVKMIYTIRAHTSPGITVCCSQPKKVRPGISFCSKITDTILPTTRDPIAPAVEDFFQ
jgi:hypothetical protein